MNKIIKSGIIVFIIATIGVLILAWVYSFTNPIIEKQKSELIKISIQEIFQDQIGFNEMNNFKNIVLENNVTILNVYKVQLRDNKIGYVFKVNFSGYGGKVEALFGYEEKNCKGVYVLEHSETPGLGSLITSKDFTKQFINKNLSDPFIPKKDVEAITGATISTRAISNAIKIVGKFYIEKVYGGEK